VDRVADERTNVPEIAEVAAGTISFEEFFEEHHRRLFSALCAATANRHEAEEARWGATCCDAGAPSEGRWLAYVIYAVVIGGLGLLVARRRVACRSTG
jgi:hypothetical protein